MSSTRLMTLVRKIWAKSLHPGQAACAWWTLSRLLACTGCALHGHAARWAVELRGGGDGGGDGGWRGGAAWKELVHLWIAHGCLSVLHPTVMRVLAASLGTLTVI